MVPPVAPLGQGVAFGQALKVRAGHVVQQQVVLKIKQLPQPVLQVDLQLFLVRQELVQGPVQPIIVDPVHRHAQQVRHGRLPVVVSGDVQFAGWPAQTTEHQDHRHQRPGNLFLPRWQSALEELRQPQLPHQLQPQPRTAQFQASLHANAMSVYGDPSSSHLVVQTPLLPRMPPGRLLYAQPPGFVHLPQVRHHPLTRPARRPDRLHQGPVRMPLASDRSIAGTNEHAPIVPPPPGPSTGSIFTTSPLQARSAPRLATRPLKEAFFLEKRPKTSSGIANCGSWASGRNGCETSHRRL